MIRTMDLIISRAKCKSTSFTGGQWCRRLVGWLRVIALKSGGVWLYLRPKTNSIASISTVQVGSNFLPGQLKVTGGFGSGFLGNFSTTKNGSIERYLSYVEDALDNCSLCSDLWNSPWTTCCWQDFHFPLEPWIKLHGGSRISRCVLWWHGPRWHMPSPERFIFNNIIVVTRCPLHFWRFVSGQFWSHLQRQDWSLEGFFQRLGEWFDSQFELEFPRSWLRSGSRLRRLVL